MRTRPFYYRLANHEPVPCSWYEAGTLLADYVGRCLKCETTKNGFRVSTAFLVFDHNPFGPEPVLWNTIVRDPDGNERLMGRYATRSGALEGHEQVAKFVELIG